MPRILPCLSPPLHRRKNLVLLVVFARVVSIVVAIWNSPFLVGVGALEGLPAASSIDDSLNFLLLGYANKSSRERV